MPTEKPRFCITVDEDLLRRIDDYRFDHRYNSRSRATLDLIRIGLDALREREESGRKAVPEKGESFRSSS